MPRTRNLGESLHNRPGLREKSQLAEGRAHQLWQYLARPPPQREVRVGRERRGLGVDLDHGRPALQRLVGQGRRRVDEAGSPDAQKEVARARSLGRSARPRGRQRLAEPDHVWPERRAAVGAKGRDVVRLVGLYGNVLRGAPAAKYVAVQLDDLLAAGLLMEAVHVLGDEGEGGHGPFEPCEGPVPGVGICPLDQPAPPRVPLPYELGVVREGLGGRELLRVVPRPEPRLRVAELGHAALGRDPGARQRRHAAGAAHGLDQTPRKARHGPAQAPIARRSPAAPSETSTSLSSPEAMSRTLTVPRESSSSPRTAAKEAPERSACLNWPFAPRPPKSRSHETPCARRAPARRIAGTRASGASVTKKRSMAESVSLEAAARSMRSTPEPKPMPPRSGPPRSGIRALYRPPAPTVSWAPRAPLFASKTVIV